jgi:hypothetical protein
MKIVVFFPFWGGDGKIRHKDDVCCYKLRERMISRKKIILMMRTSFFWEQQMKGRHAFHPSSTPPTTTVATKGSPTMNPDEESWMNDSVNNRYRRPIKRDEVVGGDDDNDYDNRKFVLETRM